VAGGSSRPECFVISLSAQWRAHYGQTGIGARVSALIQQEIVRTRLGQHLLALAPGLCDSFHGPASGHVHEIDGRICCLGRRDDLSSSLLLGLRRPRFSVVRRRNAPSGLKPPSGLFDEVVALGMHSNEHTMAFSLAKQSLKVAAFQHVACILVGGKYLHAAYSGPAQFGQLIADVTREPDAILMDGIVHRSLWPDLRKPRSSALRQRHPGKVIRIIDNSGHAARGRAPSARRKVVCRDRAAGAQLEVDMGIDHARHHQHAAGIYLSLSPNPAPSCAASFIGGQDLGNYTIFDQDIGNRD